MSPALAGNRVEGFVARWYLPLVLAAFFLIPEVRRLIDWQIGPNAISVVSIVPMLLLAPLVIPVVCNAASSKLSFAFRVLCYAWLFAFGYGLVVGFAAGGRLEVVFQFAQFCLPLICGAWLAMRVASPNAVFEQFTDTFLWLGGGIGLYGIYQFAEPPPWDVAWVNYSGLVSIGVPEPFGLRVFATLNSPGTAAFFFVFVVLLGLHKLDLRRPGPVVAVTICVAALALTNVRAAWLALAVGVVVFFAVNPQRGRALAAVAVIAVASIVLGLNASALFGNRDVTAQLVTRLDTLGDVDGDESANDRRRESAEAAHKAWAEPLGQGLGTVGTSTKLGAGGQLTLDNGYMSRFLEMGVAGFVGYLVTLGAGIAFALRALAAAGARKDFGLQQIAATAISVQVAMLGLDLSVDSHSALPGVVFWVLLALTLQRASGDARSVLDAAGPSPSSAGAPLWA
jgi:putative inorganic carbon (HCO3(-)) transporter